MLRRNDVVILAAALFASLVAATAHAAQAPARAIPTGPLTQPVFAESVPEPETEETVARLETRLLNDETDQDEQDIRSLPRKGLFKKAPHRPKEHAKATPAGKPVPFTTPIDAEVMGNDPGVAVGRDDFVITFTGGAVTYRHRDGTPLNLDSKGRPVRHSFASLFAPGVKLLNEALNRINICDPGDPNANKLSCIDVIYDGRVIYDPQRARFWIIANSRHADKKHGNGPLRFPLIGVSKSEDPRDGFNTYALVQEYADWPKLAVFEDYAIIGHHSSRNLWVLDANAMANGAPPAGVSIFPFTNDDFDCDVVSVVKQRNQAGHMAVIAGIDRGDDDLYVFGLLNKTPGKASKPVLVGGDSLDLDVNPSISDPTPVLRNGQLHLAWQEKGPFGNAQIRHIRVPIMRDLTKPEFDLSDDPARGYRETIIAGEPGGMLASTDGIGDVLDYVHPTIDVDPQGAAVVGWDAGGRITAKKLPWEVRYSVQYGDEAAPRPVTVLRTGACTGTPFAGNNETTHIDLSTAESDPGDHNAVWIAGARAVKQSSATKPCWFQAAVGRVTP